MSTQHFRIGADYVGGFDGGAAPPADAISCPAPTRGDDVWTGATWVARTPTPAEIDAKLDATLNEHFGADASEDSRVRNLMAADVLMGIDNTLTKTTALVQVRANYEVYLRIVRGR